MENSTELDYQEQAFNNAVMSFAQDAIRFKTFDDKENITGISRQELTVKAIILKQVFWMNGFSSM
ncbi:MAG: hypothetical protein FWE45_05175 [Firmicutes bacterium]|nr:hypothetical protein [Bacillota bacterium]